MSRLSHALLGASALALLAMPASAQITPAFSGAVFGQYANGSGGGDDIDVWSGGGSIAAGITNGINVQGDVSFSSADFGGSDNLDIWNFGGSLFYRAPQFVIGANVANSSFELDPLDYDITNYGGFGEFYAGDMVTLFANGGWLDGDFDQDGSYIGGGIRVYPMPNLGLTGSISHNTSDGGDGTQYGVRGEFMFSEMVPVSVYGGYDRADGDGADTDIWTIGVRWQFGTGGTLVQRDRTGPIRSVAGLVTQF
jgi:hypothetical protein